MTIEKLLGYTRDAVAELEAMSEAELLAKFAPCFDLERKLISEAEQKIIPDTPEEAEEEAGGEGIEGEAKLVVARKPRQSKPKTAAEKNAAMVDKIKQQLMDLEKEMKTP